MAKEKLLVGENIIIQSSTADKIGKKWGYAIGSTLILISLFFMAGDSFGKGFLMCALGIFIIFCLMVASNLSRNYSGSIMVTNRRVITLNDLGEKDDIPLDQIDSVTVVNNKLVIKSGMRQIKLALPNNVKVQNAISGTISGYSSAVKIDTRCIKTNESFASSTMDDINALRELKKLVDEGILTQEEFEAKKKKLI